MRHDVDANAAAAMRRLAANRPAQRLLCNVLCLWHLCPRAACQRSKACRGREPAACFTARSALVPDGAKLCLFGNIALQGEGVPRAEADRRLAPQAAILDAWAAACHEARGKARGLP
ncbi:MAG TPA: hypothetical protein VHC94_16990 [Nitrobacter sp.]|nr:hypothetical protein [Nitrobacter sp.]